MFQFKHMHCHTLSTKFNFYRSKNTGAHLICSLFHFHMVRPWETSCAQVLRFSNIRLYRNYLDFSYNGYQRWMKCLMLLIHKCWIGFLGNNLVHVNVVCTLSFSKLCVLIFSLSLFILSNIRHKIAYNQHVQM